MKFCILLLNVIEVINICIECFKDVIDSPEEYLNDKINNIKNYEYFVKNIININNYNCRNFWVP